MFESLPNHNLNLPQIHFAPIPPRPVIPYAEYAAQISKTLAQVMENLSPQERQRKKLELEILGTKAREGQMNEELMGLQLDTLKKNSRNAAESVNQQQGVFNGVLGMQAPDDAPHSFEGGPPDDGEPDTAPHEYYGYTGQDTSETDANPPAQDE